MSQKTKYIVYTCLIFALLVAPFAGMLFAEDDTTQAEKRDLAPVPSLTTDDGAPNAAYLSDLGAYFEDHFGFRNAFITASGRVKESALGSSPGDEVIVGQDGWLFYSGTLDDFFRRDPLTPRELFIISRDMRLIQDYCDGLGAKFVFVIAANKNSIYPQYMPENYLEGVEESNADALVPWLEDAGVRFADMREVFRGQSEILYYRTDSHWTDKGAAMGFEYIMDTLGLPRPDFSAMSYVEKTDQRGDLREMLLPMGEYLETCPRIEYAWQSDAPLSEEGREEGLIEVACPGQTGSLVMYRDSFGTALIPFFAECFGESYFTRGTPWQLHEANAREATAVICEKVERNLIDLAITPAVMPAPAARVEATKTEQVGAELSAREQGSLVCIRGRVPAFHVQEDTRMYISVDGVPYEAFLSTNEEREGNECYIYMGKSQLEHTDLELQLIISDKRGVSVVASETCHITGGETPA